MESARMTENEFLDYVKQQNIKCGLGWYGLIMSVLAEITKFNNDHPDEQIQINSFEERQGALHIAVSGKFPEYIKIFIDKASAASAGICEYCGCPGKLRKYNDRISKTLCTECIGKYKNKIWKKIKKADDALLDYMKEQTVKCGYGWYGLIFPVISEFKKWNDGHPGEEPENADSFESEWGTLDVIRASPSLSSNKHIDKAREASDSICEYCGCFGEEVNFQERTKILCPNCAKEDKKYTYKQLEELEEYNKAKMPEFLSELSALTKKYGIKIGGCGHCGSPWTVGLNIPYQNPVLTEGYGYDKLEYDEDTGCYTVEDFRAE